MHRHCWSEPQDSEAHEFAPDSSGFGNGSGSPVARFETLALGKSHVPLNVKELGVVSGQPPQVVLLRLSLEVLTFACGTLAFGLVLVEVRGLNRWESPPSAPVEPPSVTEKTPKRKHVIPHSLDPTKKRY